MSEFINLREDRIRGLVALFHAIHEKNEAAGAIRESKDLIRRMVPSDVIFVVDELVREGIPMEVLKKDINKLLNVLHKAIKSFPVPDPAPGSLIECCFMNNAELDARLKSLRPEIKQLNDHPENPFLKASVRSKLESLLLFDKYYLIKENVLFPVMEDHWPNFRCLGVMWSFHDDIRRDLRSAIELTGSNNFDIQRFNRLIGNIYFNMYAIKFREETILFPYAAETLPAGLLDALIPECNAIGFPYCDASPGLPPDRLQTDATSKTGDQDLGTGILNAEQIKLIFNHLPVDITFVDENNKVRYFSAPAKRIFPRSRAIIGRDVRNCHPPESVHVVEEIVNAFRSGKEDKASFWISINGEMILIQYFAVRDNSGNYKGVIEVSQEVGEIRRLQGERRLLEWNKV